MILRLGSSYAFTKTMMCVVLIRGQTLADLRRTFQEDTDSVEVMRREFLSRLELQVRVTEIGRTETMSVFDAVFLAENRATESAKG